MLKSSSHDFELNGPPEGHSQHCTHVIFELKKSGIEIRDDKSMLHLPCNSGVVGSSFNGRLPHPWLPGSSFFLTFRSVTYHPPKHHHFFNKWPPHSLSMEIDVPNPGMS